MTHIAHDGGFTMTYELLMQWCYELLCSFPGTDIATQRAMQHHVVSPACAKYSHAEMRYGQLWVVLLYQARHPQMLLLQRLQVLRLHLLVALSCQLPRACLYEDLEALIRPLKLSLPAYS